MALVSPGIEVKEIDLTNVVPAVSTSIGAIAGNFRWGPAFVPTQVSNEKQLAALFGTPTDSMYKDFLNAAQFLKYGSDLRVVRYTADTGTPAYNATSGAAGAEYPNEKSAEGVVFTDTVTARYQGVLGNSIAVHVLDSTNFTTYEAGTALQKTVASRFDGAPGAGEMHVAVIDAGGEFTGTAGSVLETYAFLGDTKGDKLADGTNNYFVYVINERSSYVYVNASLASGETTLNHGADGAAGGSNDLAAAYEVFKDVEVYECNLIIGGDFDAADADTVIAVAEFRKDAVAFVSPPTAETVGVSSSTALANVLSWANEVDSSSYGVMDSTALYVYDKYNDDYRWIPASGHIAGLCARTDEVADPWFSPAGFNRGRLNTVVKIAFNPDNAARDSLYKKRVNPIVSFPGEGIVLYGDKTSLTRASAFDRINVRRLFNTIEKAISTAAKSTLFELNDEFTRGQFVALVEPYLRDIKGRRGMYDFKVVCDETNNTPEVIDTNRFVADIYVKPARSINFITLNFIATRTGVEFSELVGG